MKYLTWICLWALGISGSVLAQNPHVKDQLESLKIAFFTNALSLNAEEARSFWPIYNSYADEVEKNRKNSNRKQYEIRQAFMGSDNDLVEKLLDEYIEFKKVEYDISKKYHTQFKEILPIRKVAQLYKAEKDFRTRILTEIRNRQNEKRRQGGRRKQN